MTIPFIIVMFSPRLKKSVIISITIINGIIGFVFVNTILYLFDKPLSTNVSPAFIWSFINYRLLLKHCMNTNISNKETLVPKDIDILDMPEILETEQPRAEEVENSLIEYADEYIKFPNNCSNTLDEVNKTTGEEKRSNNKCVPYLICIIVLLCISLAATLISLNSKNEEIAILNFKLKYNCKDIVNSNVYVSETGSNYHTKKCTFVTNGLFEIKKITVIEAIEKGYTPCERCEPEQYSCNEVEHDTWGDLITENDGELEYDTLTDEQQDLVNYPLFDPNEVYYVPNGKSYHSVEWCYTLSNSKTINSCNYDTAILLGLEPCSKCVGH